MCLKPKSSETEAPKQKSTQQLQKMQIPPPPKQITPICFVQSPLDRLNLAIYEATKYNKNACWIFYIPPSHSILTIFIYEEHLKKELGQKNSVIE